MLPPVPQMLLVQSRVRAQGRWGLRVVAEQRLIDAFAANPDNPYLVSFPRAGSHWLRMVLELYFERPTLVRAFYYPGRTDYLLLHTHDIDLNVERRDVIYLYRDPVDTVYSQLSYHQEDFHDEARIRHWSDLYGRHLDKWLCQERFTTHKTILTYEGLQNNLVGEFVKVTTHLGETLDQARLDRVASQVTKEEVKRKTAHDPQVMQLSDQYQVTRELFREKYGDLVWQLVTEGRPHLTTYFADQK